MSPASRASIVSARIGELMWSEAGSGTSKSCVTDPMRPLPRSRTTTFTWYPPRGSVSSRVKRYPVRPSDCRVSGSSAISIFWSS